MGEPPSHRPGPYELGPRVRDSFLIALTFATGIVDVASYLGLGQIFTANMTGNTVFLAIAVGEGHVGTGIRSVDALAAFAVGAFLGGRYLGPMFATTPWSREVTRVLWAELVFAAAFAILWMVVRGAPNVAAAYALIALSSIGMGMQSAVGRKLAVPATTTNVLTMAFTGLMAELTALGVAGSSARRWASVVLAMGVGAGLGAWLFVHARTVLPLPMVATLTTVCVLASFGRPRSPSAT